MQNGRREYIPADIEKARRNPGFFFLLWDREKRLQFATVAERGEIVAAPFSPEVLNAMKTEYITTDISVRDLAAKYGVSASGVFKYSKRDGWKKQRVERVERCVAKAIQKSETKEVNRLARLMDATTKAIDVAMEAFEDDKQFNRYIVNRREKYMGGKDGKAGDVIETEWSEEQIFSKIDTKALKDLTGILKDLDGLMRQYYNLPTPAQAEAQRIAAERLELDKKKAQVDEDEDESGIIIIPE